MSVYQTLCKVYENFLKKVKVSMLHLRNTRDSSMALDIFALRAEMMDRSERKLLDSSRTRRHVEETTKEGL